MTTRTTKASASLAGFAACNAGRPLTDNPHPAGHIHHKAWSAGWYQAAKASAWPFPIPKDKLK